MHHLNRVALPCMICAIFHSAILFSQQADIEGNTKIVGELNVIHAVGDSNLFIGANAGLNNVFTQNPEGVNTFVGVNSGFKNEGGYHNTYMGFSAGKQNIVGIENSFFGHHAGLKNIGSFNSFFGYQSGEGNNDGTFNSFFGYQAGQKNIEGDRNTFLGHQAGRSNKSGNRNTLLGQSADFASNIDSLDRAIAIGYFAKVGCHQCAVIGGTGNDAVNVGIGNTSPITKLHVSGDSEVTARFASNGSNTDEVHLDLVKDEAGSTLRDWRISNNDDGQLEFAYHDDIPNNTPDKLVTFGTTGIAPSVDGTIELGFSNRRWETIWVTNGVNNSSDIRLKRNIKNIGYGLNDITRLRPVTYEWNRDPGHLKIGLIAQEVLTVIPEVVHLPDDPEQMLGIDYSELIPILIQAIQELNEKVNHQEKLIQKYVPKVSGDR